MFRPLWRIDNAILKKMNSEVSVNFIQSRFVDLLSNQKNSYSTEEQGIIVQLAYQLGCGKRLHEIYRSSILEARNRILKVVKEEPLENLELNKIALLFKSLKKEALKLKLLLKNYLIHFFFSCILISNQPSEQLLEDLED